MDYQSPHFGKKYLISGVANKKSIGYVTAKSLQDQGAHILISVQNEQIHQKVETLFPEASLYICDVTNDREVAQLGQKILKDRHQLDGFLHSLAFANYSEGIKPFHETSWTDFQEALKISCFSLVSMAKALKPAFKNDASVVTVSISNTKATSYGYMGPIKAALDGVVPFLAKSFSEESQVRFNAVCSGPLKTSASAGIPGYIDNYLYAERLTLRKKALKTKEVANTICFLLGSQSSGINGQGLIVDAGMQTNYFDQEIVKTIMS